MAGPKFELKDHRIPLERSHVRGWGKVSIPADANPADNDDWFVFDEPAPRQAIIVAEDPQAARPLQLAAAIAPDPAVKCSAEVGRGRQAGGRRVGEGGAPALAGPPARGRRGEARSGVRRPRRPGDLLPAPESRARASSRASAGPTGSTGRRRFPSRPGGATRTCWPRPRAAARCRSASCRSASTAGSRASSRRWPPCAAVLRCWRG